MGRMGRMGRKREYAETLYGLVPIRHGRTKAKNGKFAPSGKGPGRKGLSAELNERILRPHRGAQPLGPIAGGEVKRMWYRLLAAKRKPKIKATARGARRTARRTRHR